MNITSRAYEILAAEAEAIRNVELGKPFEDAVRLIETCSGKIIAAGMGKAGFVAQKFASILCSTGTPAAFMHPGEAAHGDLGLLGASDCLVVFSTSGKTREVLEMVQLSRHMGPQQVIGITSHSDSAIRELCDVVIDMGVIREPCSLGLTPTASVTVMASIGDALALVVMERKGFTVRQYGLRHHGGYLGARARAQGE